MVAGGNVAPYNFTHMQISPTSDRAAYIADQEIDEKQELYSVPIDGPASAGVKLNAPLLPAERTYSNFNLRRMVNMLSTWLNVPVVAALVKLSTLFPVWGRPPPP
ncbi:MAG: hypothetical protein M5U34_35655 [Chloroflexi bacterium]|nr:hypothetical protein [Chloroflexota bacterium]